MVDCFLFLIDYWFACVDDLLILSVLYACLCIDVCVACGVCLGFYYLVLVVCVVICLPV